MHKIRMGKSKRAEMGVGTMIIFIAMVLVAAVAASVLISTANQVREQAQTTGDQAINSVASGFVVQDVVGEITAQQLTDVSIYLRVAAGSPNINMENVVISVVSGDYSETLIYADAGPVADTSYGLTKELDLQTLEATIVGQGDLLMLDITGLTVDYNQQVTIKIIPAYGQMTLITFVTPEQFSTQYITLY